MARSVERFGFHASIIGAAQPTLGVVGHLTGCQTIDHLVEIVPEVFAYLLAHLSGPAGYAARIVLVDITKSGRIRQLLQARFIGVKDRELGDELPQPRTTATGALQTTRIRVRPGQNTLISAAVEAAIFVYWHSRYPFVLRDSAVDRPIYA